jgi:hypothetical protein
MAISINPDYISISLRLSTEVANKTVTMASKGIHYSSDIEVYFFPQSEEIGCQVDIVDFLLRPTRHFRFRFGKIRFLYFEFLPS